MTRSFKQSLAICLLLAAGTLILYWPVTRHEFVNYDDEDYVTQNTCVQAGLSARSLAWVWGSEVARNWHPVTMLSHMLDCQLFGLRPGWHHFTSVLFHVSNSLLLFLLLKRLTAAVWRSALVAALFAFHPLHVESVAWAQTGIRPPCQGCIKLGYSAFHFVHRFAHFRLLLDRVMDKLRGNVGPNALPGWPFVR